MRTTTLGFAVITALLLPTLSENRQPQKVNAVLAPVMGDPEVVFYGGTSPGSCDDFDLPDMAARAWRDINGTVTLVNSWATSRFSTGPSLGTVKHSCNVV